MRRADHEILDQLGELKCRRDVRKRILRLWEEEQLHDIRCQAPECFYDRADFGTGAKLASLVRISKDRDWRDENVTLMHFGCDAARHRKQPKIHTNFRQAMAETQNRGVWEVENGYVHVRPRKLIRLAREENIPVPGGERKFIRWLIDELGAYRVLGKDGMEWVFKIEA